MESKKKTDAFSSVPTSNVVPFQSNVKNDITASSDLDSLNKNHNDHSIQDPFSDPFASITSNTMNNNNTGCEPITKNNTGGSSFYGKFSPPQTDATDFFATFNDNFNKNKNDAATFDAFGETSNKVLNTANKPSTSNFDSDNFEDEFAKIKIKNDLADFAKFDAFDDVGVNGSGKSFENAFTDSSAAFEKISKPKKMDVANAHDLKNDDRFAADYSKGETFDKDLNEILQRSLVDQ